MRRRTFGTMIGGLTTTAVVRLSPASAQQGGGARRLGVLLPYGENDAESRSNLAVLGAELARLGWNEGRNLRIDVRWSGGDSARIPALARAIVADRPDVILSRSLQATAALARETRTIPIVFVVVSDPVGDGLVDSFARPGRNVTGVTHVGPTEAQIRAMAQYRSFKTLGVLYTPTEKNSVVVLEDIRRLGREMGFHTVERTFRLDAARKPIPDGAADLVRELKEAGAQWLYLPPDSYLGTLAEAVIIPAAMQHGLPTFASTEQLMQAGALSGLVSRYYNVGQFTAYKAEQILVQKVPASAVPVETLKRFSYQIRMPAAKRLNLPPPLPMLSYAEIISTDSSAP